MLLSAVCKLGRAAIRTGSDLTHWQGLFQTNITSVLFQYHHPAAPNQTLMFYDLRTLPPGP